VEENERMKQLSDELESVPGIGPRIAQKLRLIGVNKVSDFRNKDPERLYNKLEQTIGAHVDRCVLYVFRAAVYFSNHQRHDPEKLKWWNWKD
jgi:nucleotidyltransferase/DNA polymerase involved in DNA repair